MAADPPTASGEWKARWGRTDVRRTDDGKYTLPVLLDHDGQRMCLDLTLTPNDAALLHAQLDRHLNAGWAITDEEQAARQVGATHALGELPRPR